MFTLRHVTPDAATPIFRYDCCLPILLLAAATPPCTAIRCRYDDYLRRHILFSRFRDS